MTEVFGLQQAAHLTTINLILLRLTMGMRRALGLIIGLAVIWPIEASSGASCGEGAKSSSLLSLKADIVSKTVEGTEDGEHILNGTVCSNCSNQSGHSSNQSLENLIKTVLKSDMNQSGDMPDPVANDNDTAGSLAQNLEFLYLKVVPWFQSFHMLEAFSKQVA